MYKKICFSFLLCLMVASGSFASGGFVPKGQGGKGVTATTESYDADTPLQKKDHCCRIAFHGFCDLFLTTLNALFRVDQSATEKEKFD